MPTRPVLAIAVLCLPLFGCTIPGVETSRIDSEGLVDVGGQTCEFVSRIYETPTVNGMSSYYQSTVTCGQQTFQCDDNVTVTCVEQIAAALGRT